MQRFIKIAFVFLFLLVPILLMGNLTYCPSGMRNDNIRLSHDLQQEIREKTKGMSTEEIVAYSNKLTYKLLRFSPVSRLGTTIDNKGVTPTHCVGYARVYSSICNYAFRINCKDAKCLHVVGTMKVNSVDICKNVSYAFKLMGHRKAYLFTKDHDFCKIISNGKSQYVDPSISDVL